MYIVETIMFGMTSDFYQVGSLYECSNTSTCHSCFKALRNNTKVMYLCSAIEYLYPECVINQTLDNNAIYVSFYVNFSPNGDKATVIEGTLQDSNFLNSINDQCNNFQKYKSGTFCLF